LIKLLGGTAYGQTLQMNTNEYNVILMFLYCTNITYGMYNKTATEEISNTIMAKLSNDEKDMVIRAIQKVGEFRQKIISLSQLDEYLLFSPNKIKEAVYSIEEKMYDGKIMSIRNLIEMEQKPLYDFR